MLASKFRMLEMAQTGRRHRFVKRNRQLLGNRFGSCRGTLTSLLARATHIMQPDARVEPTCLPHHACVSAMLKLVSIPASIDRKGVSSAPPLCQLSFGFPPALRYVLRHLPLACMPNRELRTSAALHTRLRSSLWDCGGEVWMMRHGVK